MPVHLICLRAVRHPKPDFFCRICALGTIKAIGSDSETRDWERYRCGCSLASRVIVPCALPGNAL